MELLSETFENTLAQLKSVWPVFTAVWYIILPALFFPLFKSLWMYYIQTKYWLALDWTLLELIPSKDIEKSPRVMESFYAGLAGTETTINPMEMYTQGAFAVTFSLEMVSDGGAMHFYIRTLKKFRNMVEAHIYAQYPNIEVVEVPDYVNDIPKIVPNKNWDLWGCDFELVKDNGIPIRTYEHFKEDVTGKMMDPLANLAEVMGKLKPGQKIWLQYVIKATPPSWGKEHGKKVADKLKGREVAVEDPLERFKTDIKDIFSNIIPVIGGDAPTLTAAKQKKEEAPLDTKLSPGEREMLREVEDNLNRIMFFTKMRLIVIGKKEGFDKTFIGTFIGGLKQFGHDYMNSVKPNDATKTYANYIFTKPRLRYRQRKILRRYRYRSMDGPAKTVFTFSTKELATVFHLPDMQVAAPSVARIEAKTGGAPSNLPVE